MSLTFQHIISRLNEYWDRHGCTLLQGYDMEVGAGTFHPATCLRSLGPEPWRCAYVQPSRRPADGRYADNPNRLQQYYQYQVLLKPSPDTIQQLYLESLAELGIDFKVHDVRFIEDNWESPTLGAWGLGWEVWLNGMEITQFTYFQQVGGLECQPVSGELTYGIERLAMYLQGVNSVYDLVWSKHANQVIRYGEVCRQNEQQQSTYNFEHADISQLQQCFNDSEINCQKLLNAKLALPAYEQVIKASHAFNLLDARRAISVTERQRLMFRVRQCAAEVAQCYLESRRQQGFPMRQAAMLTTTNKQPPASNQSPPNVADWLVEVGCEELPHAVITDLNNQLGTLIRDQLQHFKLGFKSIELFSTPRRLAFIVKNLVGQQSTQKIQRKGPQTAASQQAIEGFAKRYQAAVSALQKERIDGRDYYVFNQTTTAKTTFELIPTLVENILKSLTSSKSMRWGNEQTSFARPVRWLTCIYNDQSVACELFGISASNLSKGHRFLGDESITVTADSYQNKLEKQGVIVNRQQRKQSIVEQIQQLAQQLKANVNIDPELLEEVVDLVEQPFAVLGCFPEQFLTLPKECLIATVQSHQKYFTFSDDQGRLIAYFATISNIPANDTIRAGNEKVIKARLQDSRYFWQQDTQHDLLDRQPQLAKLIFAENKQKSAGNMLQKTHRIEQISEFLAPQSGKQVNLQEIRQACQLCKCDLVSDFVSEFPQLQGIMGYYYARHNHYNEAIAIAIKEHYQPRYAEDAIAQSTTGALLAMADRLDTLVCIFALDLKPDANKDPFSLRRMGLGLMRTLLAHPLKTSLKQLILAVIKIVEQQLNWSLGEDRATEIESFLWQRFRHWLSHAKGYRVDQLQAVFSTQLQYPLQSPQDCLKRLEAIQQFGQLKQSAQLTEANRRINNILKNQSLDEYPIEQRLLQEAAEKSLFKCLNALTAKPDYYQQLQQLNQLAEPLSYFFDTVMVMVDDQPVRTNRLRLLKHLHQRLNAFVDLSKLTSSSD